MADSTAVRVVPETQSLALPALLSAPNLGNPPASPRGSQAHTDIPSPGRVVAAVGTLVRAAILLGLGYHAVRSPFTRQSVDPSSIGTYFLAAPALFTLHAVN